MLQRGIAQLNDEKYAFAEALFREILAQDPKHADAHHQLGVTLARQSQFAAAEQCLRASLAERESGPCRRDLAWTLLWQGRDGEAIEAYRAAIGAGLREARLFNNLGNLLKKRNSLPQAEACYREAIATDASYALAYSNLAMLQQDAGQHEAAEANLKQALALTPNSPHLWQCYGGLLERMNRMDEADEAYRRGGRWEASQYVRRREAHWQQLGEIDAAALSMVSSGAADNLTPWCLLGIPALTPELHRDAGLRFAQSRWRGELAAPPLVARGAGLAAALARFESGERLRIGYLSADFYDHATLRLLAGVFELHDAKRFDVHLYSYGPDPDATARARFAHVPGTWHDVGALSDAQAAAQIAHDGIHLLVDLKGFTTGTRLGITALRPAPVIVSWLGYPGSLGHARLADYLISDAVVTPPGAAAQFSETLALMPHCYQPLDHRRQSAPRPSRAQAGLPEKGFVYCSFNQTFKLNAQISTLWARLLKATPASVLWLLEPGSARAKENLRQFFETQGVDAARVIFAPRVTQEAHLARLQLADLALDTLPVGSHTTGSDALWAGVPMVSAPGTLFAGRVGVSLLHAVGLDELVARDLDTYFQIALGFATDTAWRARVREKLAQARRSSPLFDTVAFTRDLERLYLAIVGREVHGQAGDRTPVVVQ
ncbi:tetratricopeptide repeat protein [Paraburkholderia unamae]|uniref:protein O-GlcNAc transferase n=1 Tax=Paraburkholderia unamae TaxID=219649 RepID=A0ABX5K8M6_9BURK|nr:glycosyltransferase family 41 protein [Paraburkholderia unamae]PVX70821.1 putative O-linked N-acetylglucosamine transferase (SPINDLY family) [Paraburkholderia unamae]CAG9246722.1 Putative O-linked N-acetylglucosamine transferase (SPINDLY family) [Paraburkholderia unamae]